jgi:hypothetical protein
LLLVQVTAGKEEGRKTLRAPLFFLGFHRRRVNPRAASDGGALEHAPPLLLRFQKWFLCNFWSLGTVL